MPELIVILLIAGVGYFIYTSKPDQPPEVVPDEDPPIPGPPFTVGEYSEMRIARPEQHHLVWAPTGQGKTEFVKRLILDDLGDIQERKKTVVVFDTKGRLIDDILNAKEFCLEHTVVIDPRDHNHPLNLSFIDTRKLKAMSNNERDVAFNKVASMMIAALGAADADVTAKQRTLLINILRLIMVMPNPSIMTMADVLRKKNKTDFSSYVLDLDPLSQLFFEEMFPSSEFRDTKEQVYRRLFALVEAPWIKHSFGAPSSSFDFGKLFDEGSLILINVSERVLEEYAPAFGRLIMARIGQVINERQDRKVNKPVLIYADEANVYLGDTAKSLLMRARSARVGFVPILPSVKDIDPTLRDVLLENTRTKSIGALSGANTRMVLDTVTHKGTVEEVTSLQEGEMLTISNHPLAYSWGGENYHLYHRFYSRYFIGSFSEHTTKSTKADREAVYQRTRDRYGIQEPPKNPKPDDEIMPERRKL